jgi:hypothetical protein
MHAALPPELAEEAIEKGWAEQHPVARMAYISPNVVMIYAPRHAGEIEIVAGWLRSLTVSLEGAGANPFMRESIGRRDDAQDE